MPADVAKAPNRKRVFVGDETHGPQPRSFEASRQQHAERLMRQPAFKRIADEIVLVGARKRFNQQLVLAGHLRAPFLDFKPLADLRGQLSPFLRMRDDSAHARGKISRERKFPALVGRDLRILGGGARNVNLVLDQSFVFENLAGENKSVARHHGLDEILFDLAQQPSAARNDLRGARADEADFQHVGFDDGADVEPVALRDVGVGDAPAPILAFADPGKAVIGFERVAAGGDEIDHGIEVGDV